MKTSLTSAFLASDIGQQADDILRNCVHCGFCNATCPTYQLTGDELDGPRGRIYQIKQILEGNEPGADTLLHLDRCLTCRNCETTCPSGVKYSQLLDTGRKLAEERVRRPLSQKISRAALRYFLLSPFFRLSLNIGRSLRVLLPASIRNAIPQRNPLPALSEGRHERKILLIEGCVQKSLQPAIDIAACNLFDRLRLQTIKVRTAGCCGALNHHLNAEGDAHVQIKANIDNWLPLIESGEVEAITMTASGCGVMIRDYQHVLRNDADYAQKAKTVSQAYLDPIEIVSQQDTSTLQCERAKRIAFHPPCTLQHGQKISGQVEALLTSLGHELLPFDDSHLCCGSAGTYSITQKALSAQLKRNKLDAIESTDPEVIVTANIGCQTHLQSGSEIPVRHWLELIGELPPLK